MVVGWQWVLLAVAQVAGSGSELTVEWSAPAACPDGPTVRAAVLRALGRPAASTEAPVLALSAIVEPRPGGVTAALTLTTSAGRSDRRLEAVDCDILVEAIAEIVAFALDEEVERLAAEPEPRFPIPAGPRPPAPPTPWRPYGAVGGLISAGGLPTPSGGIAARLGVQRGWGLGDLGVVYRFPRRLTLRAGPEAGGEFTLVAGTLRACVAPVEGRWALDVCGGAEVGMLRAEGFGVTEAETQAQLWVAAWGEIAPAVRLTPGWWLAGRLRGLVPLRRPIYAIDDSPETFQVSSFAGDFIIELVMYFR